MKRGKIELCVSAVLAVITQYFVWDYVHDITISLYVFLLSPIVAAKVWDWPRDVWLGTERLMIIRSAFGNKELGRAYGRTDRVQSLSDQLNVRNHFLTKRLQETSERMAREVQDVLTIKLLIYLVVLALLWAMTLDPNRSSPGLMEKILKIGVTIVVFAGPLAWDYSRWEWQRHLNHEVKSPT